MKKRFFCKKVLQWRDFDKIDAFFKKMTKNCFFGNFLQK